MTMRDLGEDAREAAVEHTKKTSAREIINKIKGWRFDNPGTAKKRWVFELIQNAIDSVREEGRPIKLELKRFQKEGKKYLVFRHNGGCFSHEELCAIIYGGTTKLGPYAPEMRYIGRFGSGFLVTHILSRKVKIEGIGEDKDKRKHIFRLCIDRTSENQDDIIDEIDDCFNQLSKAPIMEEDQTSTFTEYTYDLEGTMGQEATEIGIQEIEKLMPWILAFNDNLVEIIIDGVTFSKEKGDIEPNFSTIKTIRMSSVNETCNGEILINSHADVAVGVAIKENQLVRIEKDIPRIFVCMPLAGTEKLPIPFVVNSPILEPSEERDGVLLASETENEDVTRNRTILEEAFSCYYEIVDLCIQRGLQRMYDLCLFERIPEEQMGLKKEFWQYWQEAIQKIVIRLLQLEIVETADEKRTPLNVVFPAPDIDGTSSLNLEQFGMLYDIVKSLKKTVPAKESAIEWQQVAKLWKDVYNDSKLSFYTIQSVKNEVEGVSIVEGNFQSISIVAKGLAVEKRQLKILLQHFLELCDQLCTDGKIKPDFIDGLLLTQNGTILKKNFRITDVIGEYVQISLGREKDEIPDELKDISGLVGYNVRTTLIDQAFSGIKIVERLLDKKVSTKDVIEALLKYKPPVGEKIEVDKNKTHESWAKLLIFCALNDKMAVGLPIFTKDNIVRTIDKLDEDPILFLPFKAIDIDENYEDVIPENRIMHSIYFKLAKEKTGILRGELIRRKICCDGLIQKVKNVKIKREKLRTILSDANIELKAKEHEISTMKEDISTLPFWGEIIGRISQVPERARKFLDLILTVVCARDENWKKQIQVTCNCSDEKHSIVPAEWLANVKCDSWIPFQKGDEEEPQTVPREASREVIEELLSPEKIAEIIQTQNGLDLLSHLGFEKLDLKIRRKSIDTKRPEREIREELTEVSDRDDVLSLVHYPEEDILRMVSGLAESKENERKAQENQATGHTVESRVQEMLDAEGIEYDIIYQGADIEIWPEEEGWDGGAMNMTPYLVEIKFTTGNRARISRKQAEVAKHVKDNFFVLVVEGALELKEKLLNYDKSSEYEQEEIVELIKKNSYIIEGIAERLIEAPTPEEVEPDINGYWIKKGLWQRGKRLMTWIEGLR